ncbi:MAG: peptide-methionine (S)-S-oxide reductase MsrA [Lentisphaeria bacterium]|nr:peptide-methionine (S)-S-oxide reductase MsrA [Lentisphaeria bacterium]
MESAIIGGGCFWCVEAILQLRNGVEAVVSGYTGGQTENPSYKDICTGTTGHAEVVRVDYDETKVSYKEILELFFEAHDPTTLNQLGNDRGTQYRSVIYYTDDQQKATAEQVKELAQSWYDEPIVTEISPVETFYPAEDYHQNYFNQNPAQPYCFHLIRPKVEKFKDKLGD